jgi:peptidoglycan-associated lipoprotein
MKEILMNNRVLLSLLAVLALSLTACGGATSTQPTVEDKSVGAGGTGAEPGVEGKAVEGKAGETAADLLSKRRVHFAFDSSSIDDENRAIVEAHAKYLAANKNVKVVLEGHADERGTREYNLALGERRAQAVERMVKLLGVSADRIKVVSYGEEKPIASGHDEASWTQNRRVEILY